MRKFSPDFKRFWQRDAHWAAGHDAGLSLDPLSANRYALAGGNPVDYVGIDGHNAGALTQAAPVALPLLGTAGAVVAGAGVVTVGVAAVALVGVGILGYRAIEGVWPWEAWHAAATRQATSTGVTTLPQTNPQPSPTAIPVPAPPLRRRRNEVRVDTGAVYNWEFSGGQALLRPGETAVITLKVLEELDRNESAGRMRIPRRANFPIIADTADPVAFERVRRAILSVRLPSGSLRYPEPPRRGFEGDIVIGATAYAEGMAIITTDERLYLVLTDLGVDARYLVSKG